MLYIIIKSKAQKIVTRAPDYNMCSDPRYVVLKIEFKMIRYLTL